MTNIDEKIVLDSGADVFGEPILPALPASPIEGHQAVVKSQAEVVLQDRDFLSALELLPNVVLEKFNQFVDAILAADKEVLQRNFLLLQQKELLPYLFDNAKKLDSKQLDGLQRFLREFLAIDFTNFDSNLAQAGDEMLWQVFKFLVESWSDLDLLDSYELVIEKLAKTLTPKDSFYQAKLKLLIELGVIERNLRLFVDVAKGYLGGLNLSEVVSLLPLVIATKDFDFCKIFLYKLVSFGNDDEFGKVVAELAKNANFRNQQFGDMFVALRYDVSGQSDRSGRLSLRSMLPLLLKAQNFEFDTVLAVQILQELNDDGLRGVNLQEVDGVNLRIVVGALFHKALRNCGDDQAKIDLRARLSQLALMGLLPKLDFEDSAFDVFQALDAAKNDELRAEKFLINKLDNLDLKWAYYLLKLIDKLELSVDSKAFLKSELISRVDANLKFDNDHSNEQILKNLECLVIDPNVSYAKGYDSNGYLNEFMDTLGGKWDSLLGNTSGYAQMLIFMFVINLNLNEYLGGVLHKSLESWFNDGRVDKRFKSDLYQELSKLHLSWSDKFNLNDNNVSGFVEKFHQSADRIEPRGLDDKSAADKFEIFLNTYTENNSDLNVAERRALFDWFAESIMKNKDCFSGKYTGPAFQTLVRNYKIVNNADKSELLGWLGGVLEKYSEFKLTIDEQTADDQARTGSEMEVVNSDLVDDKRKVPAPETKRAAVGFTSANTFFDRAKRLAVAGLAVVGSFFGLSKSTVSGDAGMGSPDSLVAVSKIDKATITSAVAEGNINLPEPVVVIGQQAEFPQLLVLQKGEGLERAFRRTYGLENQKDFHEFLVKVALAEPNPDKSGVSGYEKFLAGFELAIGGTSALHPGAVVRLKPELTNLIGEKALEVKDGLNGIDNGKSEIKFAMALPAFEFELPQANDADLVLADPDSELNQAWGKIAEEHNYLAVEKGWDEISADLVERVRGDDELTDPNSPLNQGWV